MNEKDRRSDPRLNIRVPLRVRQLNKAGAPELFAESENLSQRGICFATNVPLEVGAQVEVVLRMPRELLERMARDANPAAVEEELKCTARVVHVRPGLFQGGKAGIGLHIESYEATTLEPERWAN